MVPVKTPRRAKAGLAAKASRKSGQMSSGPTRRKQLTREMLDALIQVSPLHPAATQHVSNKPPFEPQDD
jgi:hypothetical protein